MFGVEKKCDIPEVSWITSDVQLKNILDLPSSTLQDAIVHVSLNEDVQNLASLESISSILENAINLSKLATYMTNESDKSPVFDYRFLPFMSSVSPVMLTNRTSLDANQDIDAHTQRLDAMLKSWNMVKKPIIGDGNCCFRSVACSLIANHKDILDEDPSFFYNLGINDITSLSEIQLAIKLRELTVQEWRSHTQEVQLYKKQSSFYRVGTSTVTWVTPSSLLFPMLLDSQ